MKPLITEIFNENLFTENEELLIESKFKVITFRKGDFLLTPEKSVSDIYYIKVGCLRTYFLDESGKEHTLQFAVNGWWISDYIALYAKKKGKSVSYIECIKDSTLFKISKEDLDILCNEIPKIARYYIGNLETAFSTFHRRILENLTLSAKERYLSFIAMYPNIEQSVKNYHIASYLGITTESLSRIRKEIAND